MNDVHAMPMPRATKGGAIDLLFQTLSNEDVRSVLKDLRAGKTVRLPAYQNQPARDVSIQDFDENFERYMTSFPWHKFDNKNPIFKYENRKYVPAKESVASPLSVLEKHASVLKARLEKARESGKPTVFLGGKCSDGNVWREMIKKEFGDRFSFVDPYDENWDAEDNIYDELAALLTTDHIVFLDGGKGTRKEKEFLDSDGIDRTFAQFDSLDELREHMKGLTGRRKKTVKKDGEYRLSTTQIDLPKDLAAEVIAWGKDKIPDADLVQDEKESMGREDEMHATVLYGIKEDPEKLSDVVAKFGPFEVRLGLVTIFKDAKDHDVVKIDVESPDMQKLHKAIKDGVEHEESYPTYAPHVTIAYVKKGTGDKVLGSDAFRGKKFKVEHVAYKDKDKNITKMPLEGGT